MKTGGRNHDRVTNSQRKQLVRRIFEHKPNRSAMHNQSAPHITSNAMGAKQTSRNRVVVEDIGGANEFAILWHLTKAGHRDLTFATMTELVEQPGLPPGQ